MKQTYCNPLSMEDIASGRPLDLHQTGVKDLRSVRDYRSISDPSVVYHDGKWIMYPSYAVAYVSEDFVHWKHVDIGIPDLRYSPAVVQFRGKWYLSGHGCPDMYASDSPLGPFVRCGVMEDMHGNTLTVPDGCYLADGDRLYFYWCSTARPQHHEDVEWVIGTMGAECDPDAPWKLITEPVLLNRFEPDTVWQRFGEYNQNERLGWVEGQWMKNINGRYYLMCCGSGTRFSSYANGIFVSEEGPLSGFRPQKNHNPLTEKRSGLLRGAGHGSITEGPNHTLWVFYTSIFCFNHVFERRIGMDPLGVDENGELFCPAVTDTPQFAPGVLPHPERGNDAGLLPLTFMQVPEVSSAAPGRDGIYALDESILTWWQPQACDPEKTITVPLDAELGYRVEAIRIIWRDIGMEALDGITPGPFRYVVEYQRPQSDVWEMLVDASENDKDLCIDYRQVRAVTASALRLQILGTPRGIEPGLCSFTAFGKCVHQKQKEGCLHENGEG